ncbi:MAG: T9SS type A sorting domain-containing protein, partial [Bacteroidota bacterium]
WNDPANQTNQKADGLEEGYYTVEIEDSKGCEVEAGKALTQPDSLQISANTFNVDCYGGSDGAIQLDVSGGTEAGYDYFWTTEEGEGLVETDKNQSGLTAASYSVKLTDTNECEKNRTFEVTQPESPLAITNEESSNVETCYGDNTGYINVDAEGGTTPLTYELALDGTTEDDNTTGEFSEVGAGLYEVYVIDDNGCAVTSSEFDITQPEQIVINNTESTEISEAGAEDATITVDASGGTGTLYYTLNPDSAETNQTGEFTDLAPGNYFVDVTDDNNCGPVSTEEISIQSKSSGINELEKEYNFSIYPNPAGDEVQISMYFEKKVNLRLEFINSQGHKVQEKSYKDVQYGWNQRVGVTSLSSGLYFVKIYIDDSYEGKANLLIR